MLCKVFSEKEYKLISSADKLMVYVTVEYFIFYFILLLLLFLSLSFFFFFFGGGGGGRHKPFYIYVE